MIKALLRFLRVHSRGKESETPRDGFLSYAGEFHALAIGIAVGAYSGINNQPELVATMIGVALGIKTGSKSMERLKDSLGSTGAGGFGNALVEVSREPWYNILGVVVGFTVSSWDPAAILELGGVIQAAL